MKTVIESLITEFGLTKKLTKELTDAVIKAIADEIVTTGTLSIAGFGKFTVKTRASRNGVNPQTKEAIVIPESKTVGFKPAKKLKDSVQ